MIVGGGVVGKTFPNLLVKERYRTTYEQSDSNRRFLECRGGLRSREVEVCAVGRGARRSAEGVAWNRITEVGGMGWGRCC